jgi:CDP-glucose 4,6-dehydratase
VFKNLYGNKKVLITGHTGFKGAWLTTWLLKLGANVVGYSKDIPTKPSMFVALGLEGEINHHVGNVCNLSNLKKIISDEKPDFIFHLAGQAIVSTSYADPVDTFMTNAVGTMNVLESLRDSANPCVVVLITSDKCYDNVEWVWGYKETDVLGGKDIYSGSKGAAELVIKSYLHSYFSGDNKHIRIGVGRAGNVIGGGDWAKDRIIADSLRAWTDGRKVKVRSPNSTRPWQHVLEPLSGYLCLAMNLSEDEKLHGEAFNFGPRAEQNRTVVDLLQDLGGRWGIEDPNDVYAVKANIPFHEAGLLKLNCDKALFHMKWSPTLSYAEMVNLIADWYRSYYMGESGMLEITTDQISMYETAAINSKASWVS